MRRVLRILRRTRTILSLLLFLATIALWARSYVKSERTETNLGTSHWTCYSNRGWLRVGYQHIVSLRADIQNSRLVPRTTIEGMPFFYFTSSEFWVGSSKYSKWLLDFPHYYLVLLFAVLPALKLRAILRARKQTRGFEVVTK